MSLASMRGVSFSYGSVRALDNLSLDIQAGARLGVVGPNGSGKSTLIGLISGALQPASGSILLDDSVHPTRPETAVRHGVARTFQTPRVVGSRSIMQNVMNGLLGSTSDRWRSGSAVQRSTELMRAAGISRHARTPASEVPAGVLRLAEIARAALMAPRLLLLDEPYAGLSAEECDGVASVVKLAAERQPDLAVLVIDHDYRRLTQETQEVVLLVAGTLAWRGPAGELDASREFREGYLPGGSAI